MFIVRDMPNDKTFKFYIRMIFFFQLKGESQHGQKATPSTGSSSKAFLRRGEGIARFGLRSKHVPHSRLCQANKSAEKKDSSHRKSVEKVLDVVSAASAGFFQRTVCQLQLCITSVNKHPAQVWRFGLKNTGFRLCVCTVWRQCGINAFMPLYVTIH